NRKAYDDHKIISHEEFYAMTYGGLSKHSSSIQPLSPIRPDWSQSLLGRNVPLKSRGPHIKTVLKGVFLPPFFPASFNFVPRFPSLHVHPPLGPHFETSHPGSPQKNSKGLKNPFWERKSTNKGVEKTQTA
ncbi:unnamed protein product, partial [Candidula unifasciata]